MKSIHLFMLSFLMLGNTCFAQIKAPKTYQSRDLLFQFSYPADWNFSESDGLLTINYPQEIPASFEYRLDVSLDSLSDAEYKDFDISKHMKLMEKNILELSGKKKIVKLEIRSAQSYPGIYTEYTIPSLFLNTYIQWDVFVGKKRLSIMYHQYQPEEKDATMKKIAVDMINSFSFNVEKRKEKATEPVTFKINPKDVTHPTDKDFKWFEWSKAPEDLKKAARHIHTYTNNKTQKDEILYDEIKNYLEDTVGAMRPAHVEIAAIDLNNDGVCGLAISVSGTLWCGTAGCTFGLYENGGLLTVNLGTDYGPNPASNGVKASNGRFFPLVSNSRIRVDTKEITDLFTYDKVKQKGAIIKEVETGNGTLPKLTPPTAASKQFLFKRWKAVEMIGSDHEGFNIRTKNGETSEIQFGRDNKCYLYKDGVLGFAIPFIVAPDCKSLLLTQPNSSEQMSLQILSLTASQIIIKGAFFDDNIVIFKAK